jgi:hypothetical protein
LRQLLGSSCLTVYQWNPGNHLGVHPGFGNRPEPSQYCLDVLGSISDSIVDFHGFFYSSLDFL